MFVLAGCCGEQRNGPDRDGMCGQEGRLPCQRRGSDRDMTRTRPTLRLLIPDCKQRPEFILITKTLFPVCSLYNFVWPKKENYLVSAATGIVQPPSDCMLCPGEVPFNTQDSHFMKNTEKYSIRNESAFTAYCMLPVLFFLRYHQGHSQKYKSFFPKQSYSSTLMCSQLSSCCLVTSR